MIVFGMMAAALMVQQLSYDWIGECASKADPAFALGRYLNYPDKARNDEFPPNPRFWAKDIDFSCVSPWNSGGGSLRAGTLISRRHIVFAKHFPLWKGVRILFADGEGAVCPCYVDATREIGKTDIMVGLLNAEVTPNIRPAKILPSDFENYIGDGSGLPSVTFNQREEAFLAEIERVPTNGVGFTFSSSIGSKRKDWSNLGGWIKTGDSGNPVFMLIGREPVLICCLKCGGYGSGPSLHVYRREIQAAMDELCPGYKLESYDFSKLKR